MLFKARMEKVTEYERRIVNALSLARAASTEQERTQLFAIAEAWSKLAIEHNKQKHAPERQRAGTPGAA